MYIVKALKILKRKIAILYINMNIGNIILYTKIIENHLNPLINQESLREMIVEISLKI